MRKTALFIGSVFPEPESSAAGIRMMQLLELFSEAGYKLVFGSHAARGDFSADLSRMDITEISFCLNDSRFDDQIREINPDIVIFDRFMTEEQYGWRVSEAVPEAFRILNTEDLHSLREVRQHCVKNEIPFSNQLFVQHEKTLRELASIYRCDLTIMISEAENRILTEVLNVPEELLLWLPIMTDESGISSGPEFSEREGFVMIGNFRHPPNRDSVQYLKKKIWPEIRKRLPNATVHIYGSYPAPADLQLNKPEDGFYVHGRADSVKEVIEKARVLLAPLRFGAGLKGKLLSAMQFGTPSATTETGAEGIAPPESWPGILEDDPETFAKNAVELYQDELLWRTSQKGGFDVMRRRFLKKDHRPRFLNSLNDVLSDKLNRRLRNVTGAMLRYETMQATKFMSRWIEEKNKPRNS